MTGAQYIAALKALGLSQEKAAERLGVSLRTSHGYANGATIPEPVAKLLRVMVEFKQWQERGGPSDGIKLAFLSRLVKSEKE